MQKLLDLLAAVILAIVMSALIAYLVAYVTGGFRPLPARPGDCSCRCCTIGHYPPSPTGCR